MLRAIISVRVSKCSKMISQLNHILYPLVICEKLITVHNPCLISLKARCFHSCRITHITKVSQVASMQSSNLVNRVSRVVRTDAQDVLFDYLHSTRSFSFTDAEHISKNSPHFLQSMLSRIDIKGDVSRSLSKFLRYNPVNEFEPFLESLGMNPADIPLLLPRHLMFLSDDHVLLDNFHVLCDYGIPRSKMGKMYKEATEIFRCTYGELTSNLQSYENLGLSRSTVIKLVTCCPSLLIGGVNSEFAKVLEKLKELDIENDWMGGYLSSERTYNWKRMLDTMDFLDKVGYSGKEMHNLFRRNPELLFEGSGKAVYVMFGRLLKLGLQMNMIYSFFIKDHHILSSKGTKNLLRAVEFLVNIGMGIEHIASIVSNHIQLLSSCPLKGPKTVCRELKVGREDLCQIIKEDPLKLISLASKSKTKITEQVLCQGPSTHFDKTTFLLGLGYVENSEEMAKAWKRFRGRGDQLQERFDCLVEAGLDCNIARSIIKQVPTVLNQSKDVIGKKIDYLINVLGYPLESVVAFPTYLCYDMERINQRFSMYKWLREQSAAKPMLSLSTILACSDGRFAKYYVDVHPEGPTMWESLKVLMQLHGSPTIDKRKKCSINNS
ncbi:putative Mitochondrial transcription termination factor family protein [Quillaja saponaria]|uniref:Mitochondrial transcription termination factor family protein n=1 Tax=Quillaja saponaria TaxID=32244 RepID=A0AAD7LV61_QUISA|nr:putative Mitochondrial transcription termination factor family protein [Quillaja saponaria]